MRTTSSRGFSRRCRRGSGSSSANPTPAQRLGWPAIASGQNSLDRGADRVRQDPGRLPGSARPSLANASSQAGRANPLYLAAQGAQPGCLAQPPVPARGNPGEGLATSAAPLPALKVAVRSGDTPSHERAAMVRKPPDILITTPESLHLMLTSRAREILRGISHVIVDEIHAVCANKRGVFLALLLERLEAINPASFVRIGLSATQRPLDEVARYLGGIKRVGGTSTERGAEFRPVTIVDAGWRRDLDLQVIWPRSPDRRAVAGSIWPEIEQRLLSLVRDHRSTIIFANNRRTVEKLTARLNALG